MTVKMTKPAKKPAAAQVQVEKPKDLLKEDTKGAVLSAEERALVDEMLALNVKIKALKPILDRADEVKKILSSIAKDRFPADLPALLKGNEAIAEFGAESKPREIVNMHLAIAKMKAAVGGYEQLLDILKIPISAVDKYLSESEQVGIVDFKKEGSRSLKSVRAIGE